MKEHDRIILCLHQAQIILQKKRDQGKTIVLTNGCYDLLHAGHLSSLQFAKSQGDILVVAVNDDASVQRLKGKPRPIIPAKMRMRLLSELRVVDYVILFDQDNALEVVKSIKPDVYVKGEDYHICATPEGREVLRYGGRIETAPLVPNISTTAIIELILKWKGKGVKE